MGIPRKEILVVTPIVLNHKEWYNIDSRRIKATKEGIDMRKTNHVKKVTPFRAVCLEKGYATKEEIAKVLDVTPRTAYAYMIGERTPSKRSMKLIKERMNIDPFELFDDEEGESDSESV